MQFIETQGFLDYLERCNNAEEFTNNLLDKLQDATGRGQNPLAIFPSHVADPEIITIADSEIEDSGTYIHALFFLTPILSIILSHIITAFLAVKPYVC
jgi:hypothetical protein